MNESHSIPQANPGSSYASLRAEIDDAVKRVLENGRYILGEEVEAFEAEFAAYLGVTNAVGVASGTDAIELALRACGIGLGHAVLAPSHTAVATIAAIERSGARPVLIDVADSDSFTISVDEIETVLENHGAFDGCRPAAIVPVHLYGGPADMTEILSVARRYGLRVIEDCAQSHGARLDGRRTGTFGDLGAFSFYPTKNLGAFGDGGVIATNDPQLAARLRALRQYGWYERVASAFPGVNSRLDELQAAILRVKLTRLDADNERRREIARRYHDGLVDTGIRLPCADSRVEHVFHQYVIRTSGRDDLRAFLGRRGIGTAIHYPLPVHRQPAYSDRDLAVGPLRLTEILCGEIVSLPIYPQLADAEVDRVIAGIVEWTRMARPPRAGRPDRQSARKGPPT